MSPTPPLLAPALYAFDKYRDGSSTRTNPNSFGYFNPVLYGVQHVYYQDANTYLYLLTHRYYDAGTGRFINRDPIGYQGGMNLYGFADGNPVNESDPSGFAPADLLKGKDVERIQADKLWMQPNDRGSAPVGEDGRGIEVHHIGQNPNGPFREMTMTDHRGPGNKTLNHPPALPENIGSVNGIVDGSRVYPVNLVVCLKRLGA